MAKYTITLPDEVVDALDELADEADCSRSEVVTDILSFVLLTEQGQESLDALFPEEEEEEEEEGEGEE